MENEIAPKINNFTIYFQCFCLCISIHICIFSIVCASNLFFSSIFIENMVFCKANSFSNRIHHFLIVLFFFSFFFFVCFQFPFVLSLLINQSVRSSLVIGSFECTLIVSSLFTHTNVPLVTFH